MMKSSWRRVAKGKSPLSSHTNSQPLRVGGMVRSPIVTTSLFRSIFIVLVILSVLAYILWQVLLLAGNPQLHVEFPAENQVLYSGEVEIIGNTSPGSEVRIDAQPVFVADDGSFSFAVALDEGVYVFELEAESRLGRITTLERTVAVEPKED